MASYEFESLKNKDGSGAMDSFGRVIVRRRDVVQLHGQVMGPRGVGRIACDRIISRPRRSSIEYVVVDYGDAGIYLEPSCLVTKIEESTCP